ncbi:MULTISPECIES: hypothetical protein [Asticcacaulis]|uniref:hypothetical protein n=1 Tax=Asticcacaulis TaxID=76890 RepID=UPI001AE279B7|nr:MULTISPECIES: hypothetical protein [Asticcacaulis]MBP2158900.1 hypothetical protein [Asticcacaulis solisilvae]MDR6799945.1 hypothetical protein [Asticcacaulis sp. BE141]
MFALNGAKLGFCLAGIAAVLSGCSKPQTADDADTSVTASALAALTTPNPNDPVSIVGLTTIAEAKLAFKPADEFSKGYDDSFLEGKTFTFRLPVTSANDADKSSASYLYDADKEDFRLSFSPENPILNYPSGSSPEEFDYILTAYEATSGAPIEMSNAFGATVKVHPLKRLHVGVGSIGKDYMGAIPYSKDIHMYDLALKNIKLSPDEARAATREIWMEVSGTLKRSSEGELLKCVETEKPATVSNPFQVSWQMCVFSAKIDSVSIVSKSAGLLAQWPIRKDDKTPGKYSTL